MTKELLLAIDVGTQSTRAQIYDLRGNLLYKARIPLPAYRSPKPGWAERERKSFVIACGRHVNSFGQLRVLIRIRLPGWQLRPNATS